MIKLFIFDLGGVVVKASEGELYEQISKAMAKPTPDVRSLYDRLLLSAHTGEITVRELYQKMVKELHSSADPEELFQIHMKIIKVNINTRDEILLNMIEQFKSDRKVVCMTNTEIEVAELSRQDGLYDLFHQAYTSTEMGLKKPDPKILEIICQEQKVKPHEAVLIDDRLENVMSAKNMGIHGLLYTHVSPLVKDIYDLIKNE